MRIALVTPFNPKELADYLPDEKDIINVPVAVHSVHALARGLIKMGHTVSVITACIGPVNDIISYHGANVHVHIVQCKKHSFFGLAFIPMLKKIIRKHQGEYDVIHAQWTYAFAYSVIPFSRDTPSFCSVRDWCPYLMTFNHTFRGKLNLRVMSYFFKRVMSANSLVKVANSSYTSGRIRDYLKIEQVPIIADPVKSELLLDKRIQEPESTTFISIAQSLSDPRKNIASLLKAFELYLKDEPAARLLLIGTGGEEDFSSCNIGAHVFQNVKFLGRLPHEEVISWIDKSSILVHPSLEETFGGIFLEAAARGIPSIGGYASGAVPQVLDYGRAGCLCDIHDSHSVCEAMQTVAHNPEYRSFIVKNSRRRLHEFYIDEEVCKKHIQLYNSCLNN